MNPHLAGHEVMEERFEEGVEGALAVFFGFAFAV
jgi:hypothetical protein